MVTFPGCPYSLECLLCYYFIPFKNILRHIFCLLYLASPGKITEICFSWIVPLLFHLKTIWLCFSIALFFPSLFFFLKLLPFGLFHFIQSCTLLAHLPCLICVGPAVSPVRRELEHSLFPTSTVEGYGRWEILQRDVSVWCVCHHCLPDQKR